MSAAPSTLKDLWSTGVVYSGHTAAEPAPAAPLDLAVRAEPERHAPIGGADEGGGGGGGGVAESASRTEDLEHLFGGSDLSTAVKALYDFDAPHEFFGSLNRFVKKKDQEIEEVCSNYYQEFIRSNQELLGVRVDIRELRGEVTGLNDEIQEAGKVYLQKCERLIELRQMRHNSRQAVSELKRCCKVLEMCARAASQMAARQYYPALQTLQQLDQKYLPELSAHAFVQEVTDRIPALQTEIKQRVLSDFVAWMAVVGEATHDVGEHSLSWMLRRKELAAVHKQLGTATALGGPGRTSVASSVAASAAGQGQLRDSLMSEGGSTHPDEHSPTSTGQSVFDLVQLDFEPLYECVHIFHTLGALSELRETYGRRRREELQTAEKELKAQLNLESKAAEAVDQSVFGPQFAEDIENFLKHLAGFFIVEDTVLHTAAPLASGAGAVDPHALWATAMAQLRPLVERGFGLMRDGLYMLHLKRTLDNFAALMMAHGYYGVPLLQLLERTQEQYEQAALAARGATITDVLGRQDWAPVRVATVASWENWVLPHWRTLFPGYAQASAEQQAAGSGPVSTPPVEAFTHRYQFSAAVPRVLGEAKAMIEEYTEYASEWPDFAMRLTRLVDSLLRLEFRKALRTAVPMASRTIFQAVQIAADVGVLRDGCGELEGVIREQLGDSATAGGARGADAKQGKGGPEAQPLTAARAALEALRTENEDLVMQLMDQRLAALAGELASSSLWMAGGGQERIIITHMRKITEFFGETMGAMDGVLEPALVDGAFFAAFSTLNNRLSAVFTAAEVKRISVGAVHAVSEGLDSLREFADDSPVQSLSLLLDEAQQLVALLVQATAWVEARCASGAPEGLGSPSDEGGFLSEDVRGIVFPRLTLETIATVLDKLNFPIEVQETRQTRQARNAAEGALRRCARELARVAEAANGAG